MLYDRFRTQPAQNPMMSSGPRFIAPIPQPGALQAQQNAQTQQMMQDVMSLTNAFNQKASASVMALPGESSQAIPLNVAQPAAMTSQLAMEAQPNANMPAAIMQTMEGKPGMENMRPQTKEMHQGINTPPLQLYDRNMQAKQEEQPEQMPDARFEDISPYIEDDYDPDPLGLNHPNLVMPSDLGYKLPSGRSPRGPQVGQEKSYDRYMENKINQGLENIRQLDMAAEQAGIIPQGSVEQMWGQAPQASNMAANPSATAGYQAGANSPGFSERAVSAVNQAGQTIETQATNAWNGMKDAAHQYYQGADQARDWAAKQIGSGIKYGVDGMQNVASSAIQGIVDVADFAGENAIYASYKVGEAAAKQIDKIGPEKVMNTLEHVVPGPVTRFGNSALREMKEKGDFRKVNWGRIAGDTIIPTIHSKAFHTKGMTNPGVDELSNVTYEYIRNNNPRIQEYENMLTKKVSPFFR